jgi:hypothetical protein
LKPLLKITSLLFILSLSSFLCSQEAKEEMWVANSDGNFGFRITYQSRFHFTFFRQFSEIPDYNYLMFITNHPNLRHQETLRFVLSDSENAFDGTKLEGEPSEAGEFFALPIELLDAIVYAQSVDIEYEGVGFTLPMNQFNLAFTGSIIASDNDLAKSLFPDYMNIYVCEIERALGTLAHIERVNEQSKSKTEELVLNEMQNSSLKAILSSEQFNASKNRVLQSIEGVYDLPKKSLRKKHVMETHQHNAFLKCADKPRIDSLKTGASIIDLEVQAVNILNSFMLNMVKASDAKFDNRDLFSQAVQQVSACLVDVFKRNLPHKAYIFYLEQIVSGASLSTAGRRALSEFDISKSALSNFTKERESCIKVNL